MANPEHVAIVKQGSDAIRKWREKNPGKRLDLSNADLFEADLFEADLSYVNLSGVKLSEAVLSNANLFGAVLSEANLSGADLRGAKLSHVNLSNANLIGADLFEADLSRADLSHVNLSNANLIRAKLSEADMSEAKLSGARIGSTIFSRVDLSSCKGFSQINHYYPSTIGVDMLFKSGGKIPPEFLVGCGVPDELIEYLPSLLGSQQAIQFHSCFISYSTKDEEFCKRLHYRMRDEKLRVWFAPEDIKAGRKLHEHIFDAIQLHDRLLLVLTESSMNSEWVATEIHRARQREVKEKRQVLFPIRLTPFELLRDWECFDADTGKDMAREIRVYFIPDFSNWKDHDAFEAAFARLLKGLRASAE